MNRRNGEKRLVYILKKTKKIKITVSLSFSLSLFFSHPPSSSFLPNGPLQLQAHQLVDLGGKLQRQLIKDLAAEAGDNRPDSVLGRDPPLLEIKQLLLADLARRRLVLDARARVADRDVRVGVGRRGVADQHRVALGEVARPRGGGQDRDSPSVDVSRFPGADAFADDAGARVLADVDHLGARVGLLPAVCEGDGVELADGVVAWTGEKFFFLKAEKD